MRYITVLLLVFTFVLCNLSAKAKKKMVVEITKGQWSAVQIGVPDIFCDQGENQSLGQDIAHIIRQDLKNSGILRPLNPKPLMTASLQKLQTLMIGVLLALMFY